MPALNLGKASKDDRYPLKKMYRMVSEKGYLGLIRGLQVAAKPTRCVGPAHHGAQSPHSYYRPLQAL